jgi:hypothetical protein
VKAKAESQRLPCLFVTHYDEHPSRASGFRDDELVVHPDAAESDCTVWFSYEPEHWEGLLAVRVGAGRVRVSGVPYWVSDVNLGDEVRVVESAEGAIVAEERVRESTNSTFRVRFENADADDDRWRRLMSDLASFDCWFDVRTPGLLAVSVPGENAQPVADYLAARERSDELQYETGRSQ